MKLLLVLSLLLAGCDPRPLGEPYQAGDLWCQPRPDGTTYCEPLEGDKEVR